MEHPAAFYEKNTRKPKEGGYVNTLLLLFINFFIIITIILFTLYFISIITMNFCQVGYGQFLGN